jgi:hypothetical protein
MGRHQRIGRQRRYAAILNAPSNPGKNEQVEKVHGAENEQHHTGLVCD